jgi:hypothetical protein
VASVSDADGLRGTAEPSAARGGSNRHRTRQGGRGLLRPVEAQLRRPAGDVLAIHNPTTRNRQRLDIGSQYRSAIYVHDADQAARASASLAEHQKQMRKAIITEIIPSETFWKAEEYHQRYLEKQGRAACAVVSSNSATGPR